MSELTEKIGFIGGGAMAFAVAMGMINGGLFIYSIAVLVWPTTVSNRKLLL